MPSRNVMDNRINAQKNQTRADQNAGKGTWGSAHPSWGQTLVTNGKPSDQTNPGPNLGAQLRDYARIDVLEGPGIDDWGIAAEAEETGTYYYKFTLWDDSAQEFVESEWINMGSNPPVTG